MDFETRERLTDVMQEVFLSTPRSTPDTGGACYESDPTWYMHLHMSSFQAIFEEGLEAVDWQQVDSQLDTRYMDGPDSDDDESAFQYVQTLVGAAFEDAQLLVAHSMHVLPDEVITDKDSTADIFRKSKNTLLQIALIGEEEHRKIIDSADATAPLEYNGESIQWTDAAQSQMRIHRAAQSEGRGCPAHFRTVDHQGHRTTLLNAFWDSLIEYIFQEDTPADQKQVQ